MSVIKVNNITNLDGTSGPVFSGITTVSSTSHFVVPVGNTGQKVALAQDPYINNLVLALPFNSESVFDDVSPRNQGTNGVGIGTTTASLPFGVSGVTTTSSGIVTFSKYYGTSCYFDGTGDAFVITNPIEFGVGEAMTAEVWVNRTAVDASGYTNVFSSTSQNTQFYIDGNSTPGSIAFVFQSSVVVGPAGIAVTAYQWNHCVWTRDSSGNCATFVNGILKAVSTTPDSRAFNIDIIGEYTNGGYEMNGYMQDVRIYKGVSKYPFVGIATETTVFTPPNQIAL